MNFLTNKLFLSLLFILFAFANMQAQNEEEPRKKEIKIVTKTIDENGKETVTETVKSGDEISDEELDQLIQDAVGEEKSIDVKVDLSEEGKTKIRIVEQNVEVEKEIKDGDKKVMIFKSEDGDIQEVDADQIRIIKQKIGDGEEVKIEMKDLKGGEEMIWTEEEEGAEAGDVIIIEEEVIEEMDENGKVVKKTVKKKKKIVKKEK